MAGQPISQPPADVGSQAEVRVLEAAALDAAVALLAGGMRDVTNWFMRRDPRR